MTKYGRVLSSSTLRQKRKKKKKKKKMFMYKGKIGNDHEMGDKKDARKKDRIYIIYLSRESLPSPNENAHCGTLFISNWITSFEMGNARQK